ncbi:MAG: hypothetical protein OEV49_12505 [candidate division Zixibacteria bacterium]|nr:hypothetical protein [candidate division Zixibacteria bacterium]MDH3935903.1 hypothetical protein [candidate division Zixibacteria bacterium]MDH4032489.1 hypothetical protein [candidate division Zixibacteria bacterium]
MVLRRNAAMNDLSDTRSKGRVAWTFQALMFGLLLLAAAGVVADPTDRGLAPHDTTKANPPQIGAYHGHPTPTGQKLNYDSLFRNATSFRVAPKAQALIDNVMLRYGGRSELSKLTSLALEYAPEDGAGTGVKVTKVWSSDRRLKYSKLAVQPVSRFLNGQECWLIVKGQVQPASTQRYVAELYSYLVLALPLAIEQESFNGTRHGLRDDDSLEYLYLLKTDSLMIVLGVDTDEHLIKSAEGVVYGEGSRTIFKNLFSDFREVQGYTFPHRIHNFSMGLDMGALILKDVQINPTLPENLFRPNKKIEAAHPH